MGIVGVERFLSGVDPGMLWLVPRAVILGWCSGVDPVGARVLRSWGSIPGSALGWVLGSNRDSRSDPSAPAE